MLIGIVLKTSKHQNLQQFCIKQVSVAISETCQTELDTLFKHGEIDFIHLVNIQKFLRNVKYHQANVCYALKLGCGI